MDKLAVSEVAPCGVDGESVRRFVLSNSQGVAVELMEYGATVLGVSVPGFSGQVPITCDLNDHSAYAHNPAYFGATCGRYAGRIAGGRANIVGQQHALSTNDGKHCLHGGATGFNKRLWAAEPLTLNNANQVGVCFNYTSPDGESGFPGELDCQVAITLDEDNGLQFAYQAAVRGRPTIVNLTNHTYWNLAAEPTVQGHVLQLTPDQVLELNDELIPTGGQKKVTGSAYDFRQPRQLGRQLELLAPHASGLDDCFLGVDSTQGELQLLATLVDPISGRGLKVLSDQPALIVYTGNFLDGSADVGGHPQFAGLALECQQLPDAPNQPAFPSTTLMPGEVYRQISRYEITLPTGK